ncbi:MerR family transcriptional regulator [Aquabacterium sp. OR-4]|uniref:MerR family transcriptional regulator n=1 Tax=Aquabacterium sp. OR-4 TaxID=2978127 RepID=UPI0021B3BFF8|nr:MerR family transcriptional regulator [Aquabacterium sp. OR-4]MDT7835519.1 MerR family transcriptional regulator [Aquabacterium sp. OR-4]
MRLKVGELAQRSGLTVRALHHYDQIGLLKPSARTDAGYRLYTTADVARLHAIQALRHMGLPLKEIGSMLASDGEGLPAIVARQIRALDHEIAQASALRERLALLMGRLSGGDQPEMAEWLASLGLMAACARYFTPGEIRTIVGNWQSVRAEWAPLMQRVRALMDQGVAATDLRVQPLAQQWMGLIHHWLGGDFDLIERWGRMYLQEPLARRDGAPELAMVRYIEQATALRQAAWLRHFSLAEMSRFQRLDTSQWAALAADAEGLMAARVPASHPAAQALAGRLQALIAHAVGHHPPLVQKMFAAMAAEPLLRAGAVLPAPTGDYLRAAMAGVAGVAAAAAAAGVAPADLA